MSLLVSPAGYPPAYVQSGSYWTRRWYWTALMHDVAPWVDHFAAWVGPGGMDSGDLPWPRRQAPGDGVPSYQLSDTFYARPELWSAGAVDDPSLDRPVRWADVRFTASKVLGWEWEVTHLRAMPRADTDARGMVFADGLADVRRLSQATLPPVIPFKPETRPLQDTPDGVHGRDY